MAEGQSSVTLLVVKGAGLTERPPAGHVFEKGTITIGRNRDNDVVLEDPFVSKLHCVIKQSPDGYVISDTSTNGVFVNDAEHPLGRERSPRLRDGDRLRIGSHEIVVRLANGGPAAAAADADGAACERTVIAAKSGSDWTVAPSVSRPAPAASADPKHLVRTHRLDPAEAVHLTHPLNSNSEVRIQRLSDRVGMQRAHLSLARIPPGRESFIPHSHTVEEEFVFILEGDGIAIIGDARVAVGPGDYMGFPTDGTVHHLVNGGKTDLVYLMGGERSSSEVARFPTVGKVAIVDRGGMTFYDAAGGERLGFETWRRKP